MKIFFEIIWFFTNNSQFSQLLSEFIQFLPFLFIKHSRSRFMMIFPVFNDFDF